MHNSVFMSKFIINNIKIHNTTMRVLQKKSFQNAVEAARAKTPLKNSAFSQSKKCQSFNNLTS